MKKIFTLALVLMATTCFVHSADYVINHSSVTPVRSTPSEASEQETQLIFGEICEVVEHRSSWTKIRSTIDGQVGWVSSKMVTPIGDEAMKRLGEKAMGVVAVPMAVATDMETGEKQMLTIGSRLHNYAHGTFEMLGKQYQIEPTCVNCLENASLQNGSTATCSLEVKGEEVVRLAKSLLNVPYLWGGKNIMGFDCSGFTQTVYSVLGINILRNAREQITQGEMVESLAEAQPGDLVFFDHADRDPNATRITHVGMLISPTEVIHCSGCVHIDRIDEMGIHLADGELTHHLVQIKRYIL